MTAHSPQQTQNSVMSAAPGAGAGKQVVLLDSGSYPGQGNLINTTWLFTGTDWSAQSTSIVDPNGPLPTRSNACASYDGTNVLVAMGQGGSASAGVLYDFWTYISTGGSAQTWKQITGLTTAPTGRYNAEMAFLNGTGVAAGALLFSGCNLLGCISDTWFWSGVSQTWTQISVANGTGPVARTGHCMAGSSANPGTVLLTCGQMNGNQQLNDTWTYSASLGWVQKFPTLSPSVRSNACIAYDIANTQWILFSGENEYGYLTDTWVFPLGGSNWINATSTTVASPAGRIGASACYDAVSGKVIMVGGRSATAGNSVNETWSATWNSGTSQYSWAQL